MTTFPIVDPVEIAKLPDGAYIAVDGTTLLKRCTGMFACATCVWSVEMVVEDLGGIAARLGGGGTSPGGRLMTDLPAHIEELLESYDAEVMTGLGNDSSAKLRAILEKAWEVAQQEAPFGPDCGACLWCGEDILYDCKPDCPHRKLKEVMSDVYSRESD